METFVCEICKERTPKHCEGREPNTCAMCMPLEIADLETENSWVD